MSDVPPPSSAPVPPPAAPVPPPSTPPAPAPAPTTVATPADNGGAVPMVGFGEAVTLAFKQYAVGKGRATRAEYWWFQLLGVLLVVPVWLAAVPASIAGEDESEGLLIGVALIALVVMFAGLAMIIPAIALTVRRLHDSGKSAHYLWFYVIPFVGPLVMLVFMLQPSDPQPNQYGNPRGWQG